MHHQISNAVWKLWCFVHSNDAFTCPKRFPPKKMDKTMPFASMIAFRIQSRKKRKKITGSHSAAKILLHAKYQVLVVMDPLHRISFTCPPRAANAPMRRFPTAPAAPMTSTDILAFGGETRWGDPVDFAFINLQLMCFCFKYFGVIPSQKSVGDTFGRW